MLLKRSLSLFLCTALVLSLCVLALPKTARAAADASSVKLSPSGTTVVELNNEYPYLVGTTRSANGELGKNGCTAWLHGNVLEVKDLALTGAGMMPNNFRGGLYAAGDLTIALHGSNSIAVADKSAYPSIMGDASVRAVYVTNGSLTLSGNGALTATVGTGYNDLSGRCCAVSCASSAMRLTVDSGVTLTATIDSTNDNTTAVYASNLTNNGVILAESTKYGVHLCGTDGDSTSAGSLTSTSSGSSALVISSGHNFLVGGGTIELTSAAGNRAIGATGANTDTATLRIDSSIPHGLMGENETAATVCSSGFIMANYKSASPDPVYAYLRLPAGLAFMRSDDFNVPEGGVGVAITPIDVSGGVSGGIMSYTFSFTNAPSWLSISNDGVITGTRPSTAQSETTATVKVTDSASPAQSATIAITVGKVTAAPVPPTSSGGSSISGGGAYTGNQYPGSFAMGANGGPVLTVQAPCDKCVSVAVDGAQLKENADYTKECGSTIITFTPSYLATLANGTHSIRVQFTDGRYDGNFTTPFTVQLAAMPMADVPATGDVPPLAKVIEWLRRGGN